MTSATVNCFKDEFIFMHNDFSKLSKMKNLNNGSGVDKITVSSFDLDSTLIKTKSKKRFATNGDDWKFIYSNDRMKKMMTGSNTSVICIISNQLGVSKGKVNDKELMWKFANIVNSLSKILENKFICIFGAFQDDLYRKPRTKSLEYIESILKPYAGFNSIDYDNSYYVGDAAGYGDDFSDVDYKFALNAGLKFYREDEFFMNNIIYYPKPDKIISDKDFGSHVHKLNSILNLYAPVSETKRLIILVGSPASGKTSLANSIKRILLHKVDIISQDALKTVAKCKKAAISFIKDNTIVNNHTIVIDNTNRDIKTRKIWIDLANEHKYTPMIFYLTTDKNQSMHLNMYRSLQEDSDKKIPAIALNVFFAKLEKPCIVTWECELYEFELQLDSSSVNDLIYSYLY